MGDFMIKNAYFKTFGIILFSFLATIGIVMACGGNYFLNSIISIAIFFLYLIAYRKINYNDYRLQLLSGFLSLLFAAIIMIGSLLDNSRLGTLSRILFTIPMLSFSLYPLIVFIMSTKGINANVSKLNNKNLFYIIIFIGNIVTFLSLYPGVYGYDAGFEILQILDSTVAITSRFSIIYSYFISVFIKLGYSLFNSYQIGFALYAFVQMTLMDFIYIYIINYIFQKNYNHIFFYILVLFYSFFPLITIINVSSCQDVLFGGIFAVIVILLDKINKNITVKPMLVSLLIFLLFLLRNNGFYAFLVFLIIVLLFAKGYKKYIIKVSILPVFLYIIYLGPFMNFFNISKDTTINEMLSIPSQQIANVYNYKYDNLTNNQKKLINKFYNTEHFEYYTWRQEISDPIKSQLNSEYTKQNLRQYIQLWMELGINYPRNYIQAFLLNTHGLWYPDKQYNDSRMYHPYIEVNMMNAKEYNNKYIEVNRDSKFTMGYNIINYLVTNNNYNKFPIISLLFTQGFYFIIFIVALAKDIYKKNSSNVLPYALVIGLYVTLFLAPVSLFRYFFPILLIAPLLFNNILFEPIKKQKNA